MNYQWKNYKFTAVCLLIVVFILSLMSPAVATGTMQTGNFVPGEVIVKFKDSEPVLQVKSQVQAENQALGLVEKRTLPGNVVLMKTTANVPKVVQVLNRDPRVEYAQPNFIFQTAAIPNDQLWDQQWGVTGAVYGGVQLLDAWEHTRGTSAIIVAVLDTGVYYHHEDLTANIWRNTAEIAGDGQDNDGNGYIDDIRGWDFIGADVNNPSPDNSPLDVDGHGTHVAGIIAATADNNKGIAGVAPGVRIMAVKILDDQGGGTTVSLIGAINYAANNGAKVINMSFGSIPVTTGNSTVNFCQLTYSAIKSYPDILFVAAAGNAGNNNDQFPIYPANYTVNNQVDTDGNGTIDTNFPALPNIISVAALNQSQALAGFSNYGANSVDLAAPGEQIISTTVPINDYISECGTSMAAPFVAGGAGLALSINANLSPEQLIDTFNRQVTSLTILGPKVVAGGTLNIKKTLDNLPVAPKKGDLNGDGRVTAADATLVLRVAVGLDQLSPGQLIIADINSDGLITAADTTLVLRSAVGLR
ncbi:MAG: S8 family serine peptidase [Desulfotomaculum sp.]|nr:S8 family serine peptidase [Desulfotomaculum sp.]